MICEGSGAAGGVRRNGDLELQVVHVVADVQAHEKDNDAEDQQTDHSEQQDAEKAKRNQRCACATRASKSNTSTLGSHEYGSLRADRRRLAAEAAHAEVVSNISWHAVQRREAAGRHASNVSKVVVESTVEPASSGVVLDVQRLLELWELGREGRSGFAGMRAISSKSSKSSKSMVDLAVRGPVRPQKKIQASTKT
eukprot:CAMPEP_0114612746 /NCGR_PEP_ID=MMETSP0168-20121206/4778_1 /TAXON_ID=95228 ORGANISM="Vannella sp., Strain DIVA3 517/6/12" /NCGR_SAMPLE_ID=MMETSP0168 /ASSEMBLY_ACC=CAM_ASM_000044 /LENGTH=195 /DNA_ID=CAMNT_0001823735 /DNA_START=194 /DNA_END=781 /DNA_ORIENTATION=+